MRSSEQKNETKTQILMRFLKEYGFFVKSDSIYEGLFGIYDKGPASVKLKKTIKDKWWDFFVTKNEYVHPYESSILTSPKTLKASGHTEKFLDQVWFCSKCNKKISTEGQEERNDTIFFCTHCKSENKCHPMNYDLLFETWQGCEKNKKQKVYLRPETAQGIFTNFKKIKNIWKLNLPFGLAQTGKAFRNEITTKYTGFKSCEFELMEIEFFFGDKTKNKNWFNYWKKEVLNFLFEILKINKDKIRIKDVEKKALAHYSEQTLDFEYHFPFGWREIWGLAMRGDFDLKQHQKTSGNNLQIAYENKQIFPHVIEPSVGLERLMIAIISEKLEYKNDKFVLQMPFDFCYYQIAILPLTEKMTPMAQAIQKNLQKNYSSKLDNKRSIGKRYVFHDAIGTFFCITIDYQSKEDQTVTVRYRDTKKQVRVKIKDLNQYLQNENSRT